jgi:predicted CoA-binding protein
MTRTARKDIDDFLRRKRILVVGVSRNPKDFTRMLFRELLKRGYEASPVNPGLKEVDGVQCFARVADADPPADAVLLLTKPEVTERVALECADAQVRMVWMYRAVGSGAVSRSAAAFCRSRGMRVIEGECPFMFLENGAWPHRLHARCRMLLGKYPR